MAQQKTGQQQQQAAAVVLSFAREDFISKGFPLFCMACFRNQHKTHPCFGAELRRPSGSRVAPVLQEAEPPVLRVHPVRQKLGAVSFTAGSKSKLLWVNYLLPVRPRIFAFLRFQTSSDKTRQPKMRPSRGVSTATTSATAFALAMAAVVLTIGECWCPPFSFLLESASYVATSAFFAGLLLLSRAGAAYVIL